MARPHPFALFPHPVEQPPAAVLRAETEAREADAREAGKALRFAAREHTANRRPRYAHANDGRSTSVHGIHAQA